MSARLNNSPTYVIYDRTYQATITQISSVTGGGDHTMTPVITGTTSNTKDKDLTTYWDDNPIRGAGGGSNTYETGLKWDLGAIKWNCTLWAKWSCTGVDGGLFYSTDDITYTALSTTLTSEANFNVFSVRYIKIIGKATDAAVKSRIYEMRVMGSD